MLDRPRPAQLERQTRRRQQRRDRQRRHRQLRAAGVVVVRIPIDCEIVGWLRRTQWLVGEREGVGEIADALLRLLADSARRT
jgi:hypothetical protein